MKGLRSDLLKGLECWHDGGRHRSVGCHGRVGCHGSAVGGGRRGVLVPHVDVAEEISLAEVGSLAVGTSSIAHPDHRVRRKFLDTLHFTVAPEEIS